MVRILYAHWKQMPTADVLMSSLPEHWKTAAFARYGNRAPDAARAGLTGLLLLYAAGVSGDLRYAESGRPYLADAAVDFNFTHTEKLTVCAISTSQTASSKEDLLVGIDAESGERIDHERIVQIAKRWFSAEELRILLGMRDPSTFLQIWTRKEALVKRSGEGLKGLREANTASLAESLQLHSFWIGDTVSAVCAHRDADIEEPVCMDQELLALFASK